MSAITRNNNVVQNKAPFLEARTVITTNSGGSPQTLASISNRADAIIHALSGNTGTIIVYTVSASVNYILYEITAGSTVVLNSEVFLYFDTTSSVDQVCHVTQLSIDPNA